MQRKLSKFTFYKDTPFLDMMNSIYFSSIEERDSFFNDSFEKVEGLEIDFNFVRDRLSLNVPKSYEEMEGVNYCKFISQRDNKIYYAYVNSYKFFNEKVTRVELMIDPVITEIYGDVLEKIKNVEVIRQHLTDVSYNKYLHYLKTNDDVLKTYTKKYVHQDSYTFSNFYVLFQCSVDLSTDFGDVNDPKLTTSTGQTRDKVTSPIDLYVVDFNNFNSFVKSIQKYAWVVQNIKQVKLVPDDLINPNDLKKVTMKNSYGNLYTFKDKTVSKNESLNVMKYSLQKIATLTGFNKQEDLHMLRNEYVTLEFYSYDGQSMLLDCSLLDIATGIDLQVMYMTGYTNEIVLYPKNYSTTSSEVDKGGYKKGTFLNNALRFNVFDDLPVVVDNYNLALSKSANQRALTESKLLSNRLDNIKNGDDLQSRMMDTVSVLSDVSVSGLFGKFSDEYEFYRQQKAEFKDLALQTPTITNQTNGNSFNIKNDIYGVNFKISCPDEIERDRIRKYYSSFGFDINEYVTNIESLKSMSVCNYLQFKGNWNIKGLDVVLMEQLRITMENGVRFWKPNGSKNPMTQNILDNRRVI